MLKTVIGIMIFLSAIIMARPAYAQGGSGNKQIQVVEGRVVDVDWVGSTIAVRWLNTKGILEYDELTIIVPSEIKITKGTETWKLFDLGIGDLVTVEYQNQGVSGLRAVGIKVHE